MNRIDALFARLKSEGRPALMPFVTAGDPDLITTAEIVVEILKRGADMIEIGIPYSDPIADGPVIAASYTRALKNGIKLSRILDTFRTLRAEDVDGPGSVAPLVTMVSYAIIHRQKPEVFLESAVKSGFDGLIVPDLPFEEAGNVAKIAESLNLKLIQLVTPTTPRERALRIASTTTGFIYYVSVAGITGERRSLPPDLADNVAWLRSQVSLPICIGFGIGSATQIKELAHVADGLIVGSALVRRLEGAESRPRPELVREIGQFVAELSSGLQNR